MELGQRAHVRAPPGLRWSRSQHAPKLFSPSLDVKAELIAALGVQELIVIPFDAAFAARSAQEFIDEVLVGTLGAVRVSVGENFRFGNRAKGDTRLLAADGRFQTTALHPLAGG